MIPKEVLNGPNLVYYSDLVIGAGGTMNREATVLGTPVYTIFKGRIGSVDQHLIESGKMVRIENTSDIPKIKYCKKKYMNYDSWNHGKGLVN
jgi:predicted glycosyltransferase